VVHSINFKKQIKECGKKRAHFSNLKLKTVTKLLKEEYLSIDLKDFLNIRHLMDSEINKNS
jgi:hypothetical protein